MRNYRIQLSRCEKAEGKLQSECDKMMNQLLIHFDESSFDVKELNELSVMYQDSDGFVVVSDDIKRNNNDSTSNCSVNMLLDHIDRYGMITRQDFINCLI